MPLTRDLSPRRIGLLMALSGMLVISTDSLITRAADAEGWDVAFWYGAFSAPAMALYLTVTEGGLPTEAARRSGPLVLVSGLLQTVSTTAFILAVKNTTVANVVVIIAAAPLLTAILARLLLGEQTARRTWIAIAAAMAGIVVVVSGSVGGGGIAGDILAVLAISAFALNLTIWRHRPEMSRILVLTIAGVTTATVAATQAQILGHPTRTYLLVGLMGLALGPLGRVALASATRYLTAAEVSLFTPVETVAASIWAWAFFAEVPGPTTWIGGVAIVGAVLYGTLAAPTPAPPATGARSAS